MPKANTAAEFFEALGLALYQWSRVEAAYCDLFIRLVLCAISGGGIGKPTGEGFFILGNVFNSASSLQARLKLLNHMMKRLVRDEALLAKWKEIKKEADSLSRQRNILAHGEAWHRENSEAVNFMRYSIFSMSDHEMEYQQILDATPTFFNYAERVQKLAIDVNAHLAARKRPDQDLAN